MSTNISISLKVMKTSTWYAKSFEPGHAASLRTYTKTATAASDVEDLLQGTEVRIFTLHARRTPCPAPIQPCVVFRSDTDWVMRSHHP